MKKTILILISFLVASFIALSLLDTKSEYTAEKALWKISQEFKEITKDPKTTPQTTFANLRKKYIKFIKKFSKSKLLPMAHISLGRTLIYENKFDEAINEFETTIKKYKGNKHLEVQLVAEIGRVYTIKNDTQNVMKTYQRILDEYPLTEIGLKTPLYIANFHATKNDTTTTKTAFENAIKYYKKLINKYPDSIAKYKSLSFVATCFIVQRQWAQAVNIYAEILTAFPNPKLLNAKNFAFLTRSINVISVGKLKDYSVPIKIYTNFINKYPNHPANKELEKIIIGLKEHKNQQIKLSQ